MRLCISAGGCNCSRANYAAALVAAQLGADCLPASWLDRVTGLPDIVTNITRALDTLDTLDTLWAAIPSVRAGHGPDANMVWQNSIFQHAHRISKPVQTKRGSL